MQLSLQRGLGDVLKWTLAVLLEPEWRAQDMVALEETTADIVHMEDSHKTRQHSMIQHLPAQPEKDELDAAQRTAAVHTVVVETSQM